MLDWICDIQPDTPSILVEKTEKTPTMSLIAKTFQISLEEGSHQLLQTLLKKAVQHKIIEYLFIFFALTQRFQESTTSRN